jgi:hypothetical protein
MGRERILVDIENTDQAAKAEEMVKSGYCDEIEDLVVHWVVIEEDLIDSYKKLLEKNSVPAMGEAYERYRKESQENIFILGGLLEQIQALSKSRKTRIEQLKSLEKRKIK